MSRSNRLSLTARFIETVEREGLLPVGSSVLVAVSGGADSVCLLELLRIAAPRRDLNLAGFHLNHRLRPAADDDETFVRALFEQARLPLTVVKSDVRGHARRRRLGIEESGRELRYRYLKRTARRLGCARIALGHTADDNLETLLLNLIRGTGMTGLSGIPIARETIVRPLLDLTRSEIEDWLKARKVTWREDESNRDENLSRNRIRLRVVPVLRELNPEAAGAARRAARLLAAEDEFLEALAREALARVARRTSRGVDVDVAALLAYNGCLKRRMIRQLVPALDSGGVERVLAFLAGRSSSLALPGGIGLVRVRPTFGAADGRPTVRVTKKGGHGR